MTERITHAQWSADYIPTTAAPFEVSGGELKVVTDAAKERPFHVWTLIENAVIRPGLHFQGRSGYYITTNPYNPRINIEVTL